MGQRFQNFVNGAEVPSRSGRYFLNVNPACVQDIVGEFPQSTPEDLTDAIEAAGRAFPAWAATPAPRRGEILYHAAELLEERLEQLAAEMTREEGKTLPEARAEVLRSIHIFRYFAGEGVRLHGQTVPSERPGVFNFTFRKPLGVVGLITPWNFPSAIPAWKLAPALVSGNTAVLKPASLAPLSSYRLAESLHQAGVPPGVVNFVTGPGGPLGEVLVQHPAVRAISFTGSCEVGNHIYQKAAARKLKVQLEMGGKNPTLVLPDADLDYATEIVVNGAFASTGQKCTATSRAIVDAAVYDRFLERLVARTRVIRVGNGIEPGVEMGPCVDERQLETVLRYIAIGQQEGARLLCGGRRLTEGSLAQGYFVEPAVFADVNPHMRIAREEIFGPVLAVLKARDLAQALELANCVPFGLSASILTRDVRNIFQFIHSIEAGLITVNLSTAGVEYQLPFGGTKESSFGLKEQGWTAIEFYTDTRTVYLKYEV